MKPIYAVIAITLAAFLSFMYCSAYTDYRYFSDKEAKSLLDVDIDTCNLKWNKCSLSTVTIDGIQYYNVQPIASEGTQ